MWVSRQPLLVTVLVVILSTGAVRAEEQWSVYVNGRQLATVTKGSPDGLQVDAGEFAKAAGATLKKDEASGQITLNEKRITSTTTTGAHTLVSLKEAVEACGFAQELNKDLQMIEVRRPRQSRKEFLQEIMKAPSIQTGAQMDFLFGLVWTSFNQNLPWHIPYPKHTWVTHDELQKIHAVGEDGLTQFFPSDKKGQGSYQMWVQYGLSPNQTLHTMAHEVGHCTHMNCGWRRVNRGEGFCEWVAYKVLEGLRTEIPSISSDPNPGYEEDFEYYRNLERTGGIPAVMSGIAPKH